MSVFTPVFLRRSAFLLAFGAIVAVPAFPALSAPGHSGGHAMPFGEAASASKAKRTVTITLKDNLYEPSKVTVTAGETVRFVLVNKGDLLHEFAIGRKQEHLEHQKMMAMMLDHGMITTTAINHDKMKMDHGAAGHMHGPDSGSVLIEPGKRGEITWKFTQALTLEFACTIPGHYESGMVGQIDFRN